MSLPYWLLGLGSIHIAFLDPLREQISCSGVHASATSRVSTTNKILSLCCENDSKYRNPS